MEHTIPQHINTIRYKMNTSTLIGHATTRTIDAPAGCRYRGVGLFKTNREREYFLSGTRYAWSLIGKRLGGTEIVPLTRSEACAWAEKYLDPEIVEKEFGSRAPSGWTTIEA